MRIITIDAPDEGKDAVKWTFKQDDRTRRWYSTFNNVEELVSFSVIQNKIDLARDNNWRITERTLEFPFTAK